MCDIKILHYIIFYRNNQNILFELGQADIILLGSKSSCRARSADRLHIIKFITAVCGSIVRGSNTSNHQRRLQLDDTLVPVL